MCAPCRHLFISSASLSWMEVNFLNQNLSMPSWPGVFQFEIFLVLFWVNWCVFPLSDLLQVLLILLPCCLSIQLFCYVFLVAIFWSKIVWFLLHLVVGMFLRPLPTLVGWISFRCFGMSCFVCIFLPFLDIFLIFFRQYFLVYFFKLYYYFIWKSDLTDKMKHSFFQAAVVSILLYGCTT